jgi:hypothetical protein
MSMNAFLAEHYGTNGGASAAQDDFEKQASVELFCKLASEEGIDLNSLSDAQVQGLYDGWLNKEAEEEKKEEEKKVEKAKEEHEEKKESAAKFAEADFLGRVMAHSFAQESEKIAWSAKELGTRVVEGAKGLGKSWLSHVKGENVEAAKQLHRGQLERLYEAGGRHTEGTPAAETGKMLLKERAKRVAAIGAPVAAVGAAGAAGVHHATKKESSALDELAFGRAAELAYAGGFDPDEAQSKIAAAFTLDLIEDSMKVASASDLGTAVDIRALELLERVGYPITWNQ